MRLFTLQKKPLTLTMLDMVAADMISNTTTDSQIKQLGPCNINRSIESTNEISKFIDNIQQDNAIVVIVNLIHEVICIILFFFFF